MAKFGRSEAIALAGDNPAKIYVEHLKGKGSDYYITAIAAITTAKHAGVPAHGITWAKFCMPAWINKDSQAQYMMFDRTQAPSESEYDMILSTLARMVKQGFTTAGSPGTTTTYPYLGPKLDGTMPTLAPWRNATPPTNIVTQTTATAQITHDLDLPSNTQAPRLDDGTIAPAPLKIQPGQDRRVQTQDRRTTPPMGGRRIQSADRRIQRGCTWPDCGTIAQIGTLCHNHATALTQARVFLGLDTPHPAPRHAATPQITALGTMAPTPGTPDHSPDNSWIQTYTTPNGTPAVAVIHADPASAVQSGNIAPQEDRDLGNGFDKYGHPATTAGSKFNTRYECGQRYVTEGGTMATCTAGRNACPACVARRVAVAKATKHTSVTAAKAVERATLAASMPVVAPQEDPALLYTQFQSWLASRKP